MDLVVQSVIIIILVGEKIATKIFKYLDTKDIEVISKTMLDLKNYSKDQLIETIKNFKRSIGEKFNMEKNNLDYLTSILKNSLGENKASFLMERIWINYSNTFTMETLKKMQPKSIFNIIKSEHPQIISVVITLLNRDHASKVLSYFDKKLRNEIFIRIATMDNSLKSETLNVLDYILLDLYKRYVKSHNLGGILPVVEILNYMDSSQEEQTIEVMRKFNKNLADKILSYIFTFNDLQYLDDRSLRRILQEISIEELSIALKNTSKEFLDKIFSCMSNRQAKIIKDDLELNIDIETSQIENIRKKILNLVRYLHDSNKIFISKYGAHNG